MYNYLGVDVGFFLFCIRKTTDVWVNACLKNNYSIERLFRAVSIIFKYHTADTPKSFLPTAYSLAGNHYDCILNNSPLVPPIVDSFLFVKLESS